MDKPLIVFVSAVYPSQHSLLCTYLRKAGLADTWFMTTPGHASRNADRDDHLLPFQPDGPIVGQHGYYYSRKLERSARIGRGVLQALKRFEAEQQRKIDVLVCHSLWGAPNWLYDELQAAVVSYIEFPSYRAHGHEPEYPPDPAQRQADRNMEMLHFHQVLQSDLTIVPSVHARSLFPALLQDNIAVQFEGFDIQPLSFAAGKERQDSRFTIGFAARDLSSAKGFETFMRLVDRMLREGEGERTRFVVLGDHQAATYGYETQWVERRYQGEVASFRDHLLKIYPATSAVEFPGLLSYEEFSRTIGEIDLFLYPLRFGVANWGLMEILARGACVLGSNWGFVPELIQHDVNGLLLPDCDDDWIQAIRALRSDPERMLRYRRAAAQTGRKYHLTEVAPRFMKLFELALAKRHLRLDQHQVDKK